MDAATRILLTLDSYLTGHSEVRLMGGAALILAYGMRRSTEDVDLLQDQAEVEFLAEECNLGPALEATNADLEHLGLYISHIWGPEQEILTPEWREHCREVPLPSAKHLRLLALGPLDLIVSKLCRADTLDLADIRHVIECCDLTGDDVRDAMRRATVPADLAPGYPGACRAVEALLETIGRGIATNR